MRWNLIGVLALSATFVWACGSDKKEDPACGEARSKLQTCGVDAVLDCNVGSDALHVCLARCMAASTCEDLPPAGPTKNTNPYYACALQCDGSPADAWICDQGAIVLRHEAVCNGTTECADKSDEADCKTNIADAGRD